MSPPLRASAVFAAVMILAGCGGASGHKASSSSTTTVSTSAASGGRLAEMVRVNETGKPQSTTAAKPGDRVQIRTKISASPSAGAQVVTVSATTGPARMLHITATTPGHRARAQITSADGTALTLTGVRYTCALPPAPTACPARRVSGGSHSFKVTFSASPRTGVLLMGTVGPVAGPPTVAAGKGGLPTSAYIPTELLQARAPGAATGGSATTGAGAATTTTSQSLATSTTAGASRAGAAAVSASPGDHVIMITRLQGSSGGLPQPTTVTIDRGPASSLTVSAAVPEAHTSKATIRRVGGGKLALAAPVFACAVPPTPTFCPPTEITSSAGRYRITFMARPHSPPIILQATVRG